MDYYAYALNILTDLLDRFPRMTGAALGIALHPILSLIVGGR